AAPGVVSPAVTASHRAPGQDFVIRVGDREHLARVVMSDPPVVEVDGVVHEVTAIAGGRTRVRVAGETSQQIVDLDERDFPAGAALSGVAVPVEVRTAQAAARDAALAAGRTGGAAGGLVKAPMPGRVVRVLVEVGMNVA